MRFWVTVLTVSYVLSYLEEWTLETIGVPALVELAIVFAVSVAIGKYFGMVKIRTERYVRSQR